MSLLPLIFFLIQLCRKCARASEDGPWEEDRTLVDFKIVSFNCPDCMERDWKSIINVHGKFPQIAFLILSNNVFPHIYL